jgi:signal transduction histidine kinase
MKSWINRAGVAGGVLCTLLAAFLVVFGFPLVGRSRPSYAALATVTLLVFTITCFAVAAVIATRSRQPLAIYAAVMLVLVGGAGAPYTDPLAARPELFVPARLGIFLLIASVVGFLLLFPTGRPVPRWSPVAFAIWGAALLAVMLVTPPYPPGNPPDLWGLLMFAGFVGAVGCQIWRWLKASDTVGRAQTRWVLLGLGIAILCTAVGSAAPALAPGAAGEPIGFVVVTLGSLAIPISIGIAVTRYRLWDVDLAINRAAVYIVVGVILVAAYLAIVLGTEAALAGQGQTLLSLAAAALVAVAFQPLRQVIQRLVNRVMYGDRDDPRAVLQRLGGALEESAADESVLPRIAGTVASALRLPYVAFTLRDGQHFDVGQSGLAEEDLLRLPLAHQGEPVGELLLAPRGPRDRFSPKDLELLRELAVHIGAAAHGVLLEMELRQSRERLVNTRAEERRRLRRDLHDGLGPQLVSLALQLEAARNRCGPDDDMYRTFDDLARKTRAAIADLRRLVYALRPPALDEVGLAAALEQAGQLAAEGMVEFEFEEPGELPPLPAAVEVAAYRIAQEALTNVVRHSRARQCRLRVAMTDGALQLEVTDDGFGIAPAARSGIGLRSMRERAEEIGGRLEVVSSDGGGTRLVALLPCAGEG